MPTRISAGVGDHPCFLTFIAIIPFDCTITIFSLYLLLMMKMWGGSSDTWTHTYPEIRAIKLSKNIFDFFLIFAHQTNIAITCKHVFANLSIKFEVNPIKIPRFMNDVMQKNKVKLLSHLQVELVWGTGWKLVHS